MAISSGARILSTTSRSFWKKDRQAVSLASSNSLRISSVIAEVCPADFSCSGSSPLLDASGLTARTVSNRKKIGHLMLCLRQLCRFARLIRDVRLDEFRQKSERLLPAKIASFSRNDARHSFLDNVQLRSARYFLEGYGRLHFSRQVRVIEFVRVANAFVW